MVRRARRTPNRQRRLEQVLRLTIDAMQVRLPTESPKQGDSMKISIAPRLLLLALATIALSPVVARRHRLLSRAIIVTGR